MTSLTCTISQLRSASTMEFWNSASPRRSKRRLPNGVRRRDRSRPPVGFACEGSAAAGPEVHRLAVPIDVGERLLVLGIVGMAMLLLEKLRHLDGGGQLVGSHMLDDLAL